MENMKYATIAALCLTLSLSACKQQDAEVIDESKPHDHPAGTEHPVSGDNKPAETHDMNSMGGMSDMMQMLEGKTGDEFDKAFIQSMRPHHQSAIDMAKLAETQAKHDEIKQLAKEIIVAQNKEIDMMKQWERDWKYTDGHTDHSHDLPVDQSMTNMLKGKTGDEFDKAFIAMMIPHHQGAVDMAGKAKISAKHEEIKTMANEIISSQNKEIKMMRDWQKAWGYSQ